MSDMPSPAGGSPETPSQGDSSARRPAGADAQAAGGVSMPPASNVAPPVPVLDEQRRSRDLGWCFAVLASAGLFFTMNLSGGARMSQIECWVAQTAREMIETGDWLTPHFGGEIRLHKTPGAYWLAAGVSMLRGTDVDAGTVRSINAVFMVALVGIIMWWVWRHIGSRPAVFAGATLAASLFALYWSHMGSSDPGVAFFCTAALLLFWEADHAHGTPRRRFWLWMAFYAAFGMGMLYKGPFPLPIVGTVIILYWILFRRWRLPLEAHLPIGLLVFCVWFLPWGIYIYLQHGQDALNRWNYEFIARGTGQMPNYEEELKWSYHLLLYIGALAAFLLPWTLSVPSSLILPFRKRWRDQRRPLAFLLVWAGGVWLFLTAFFGKENRYILPAIPPLAMLLGVYFSEFFRSKRPRKEPLVRLSGWLIAVLLPVGLIGGGFGVRYWALEHDAAALPGLLYRYAVVASVLLIGFGLAAWLFVRRRESESFGAMVVTMFTAWSIAWSSMMPIIESQRTHVQFAHRVRELMSADELAHTFYMGSPDARVMYYGNFRIPRAVDNLDLLAAVHTYKSAHPGAGKKKLYKVRLECVGEAVYEKLVGDKPVWFMSSVPDYERLLNGLEERRADLTHGMPQIYEWHRSQFGKDKYKAILFSNVPPPATTTTAESP